MRSHERRFVLSAPPKLDASDQSNALGLFEHLPLEVVRQILLVEGPLPLDETFGVVASWVDPNTAENIRKARRNYLGGTPNETFNSMRAVNRATAKTIRAVTTSKGFFEALSKRCFPHITRLPFDVQFLLDSGRISNENSAWRMNLARMITLFRWSMLVGRGVNRTSYYGDLPYDLLLDFRSCDELAKKHTFSLLSPPIDSFLVFGNPSGSVPIPLNTVYNPTTWLQAVNVPEDIVIEPAKMTNDDIASLIVSTARLIIPYLSNDTVTVRWTVAGYRSGITIVERTQHIGLFDLRIRGYSARVHLRQHFFVPRDDPTPPEWFARRDYRGIVRYQYGPNTIALRFFPAFHFGSLHVMYGSYYKYGTFPSPGDASFQQLLLPGVNEVEMELGPLPQPPE